MGWKLITHKQYPVFSRKWILEAFRDDMKEALGMGFSKYKSLYDGIYFYEEELDALRKLLLDEFNSNIDSIFNLFKKWKEECDDLLESTSKINAAELKDRKNEDLILLLREYVAGFRKTAAYIFLSHVFEGYLENWLEELINQKVVDEKKKKHYFFVLTFPKRHTFLEESKKDFADLIRFIKSKGIEDFQKDEDILKRIRKYTDRYKWLGYDTGIGYDIPLEDTVLRIKDSLGRDYKESSFEKGDIKQECEDIMDELGFTDDEKKRVELIDELIFMRNYRSESNSMAGLNVKPLLEEIAARLRVKYEDIINLTLDEIEESMKKGSVDIEVIKKRKEKFGLLMWDGKISIYSGEDVRKIEEDVVVEKDITEFRGLIANGGSVRSRVKILTTLKDMDKVEPGDIIVSKLTTPDFMVAIERCIGIITDAGGISSHAAIVARELGKPCVTGTKIATKVLHDGDIVDLDADNGIVRIIKRK